LVNRSYWQNGYATEAAMPVKNMRLTRFAQKRDYYAAQEIAD